MTKAYEIGWGALLGAAAVLLFGVVALFTVDDGPMPPSYWNGDPP